MRSLSSFSPSSRVCAGFALATLVLAGALLAAMENQMPLGDSFSRVVIVLACLLGLFGVMVTATAGQGPALSDSQQHLMFLLLLFSVLAMVFTGALECGGVSGESASIVRVDAWILRGTLACTVLMLLVVDYLMFRSTVSAWRKSHASS